MAGCRPLSDAEITQVVQSFTGRWAVRNRALFYVGIRAGYRISELLSLKVKDVRQHGTILDRLAVEKSKMKGNYATRECVLHLDAKNAIAEWIDQEEKRLGRPLEPNTFLFRSQIGVNHSVSRSHATKFLHDVYDSLGFTGKLGSHAMRKTFANILYIRLDRDLVKLQHAMGHASVANTAKYVSSFTNQEIDDAILFDDKKKINRWRSAFSRLFSRSSLTAQPQG